MLYKYYEILVMVITGEFAFLYIAQTWCQQGVKYVWPLLSDIMESEPFNFILGKYSISNILKSFRSTADPTYSRSFY